MSLTVTHAKVSAIADDPAASAAGEVLPSDWNAAHTVSIGSLLDGDGSQVLVTKNTNVDNADNGDLRIAAHAYDINPISGRWNQVYRLGYNMGTTGTGYVAGEPSMGIQWESFYEQGGAELLEWHQSVFKHSDNTEVRFESWAIDRSTYKVSKTSTFETFAWYESGGTILAQWYLSAGTFYADFSSTRDSTFRFAKNNYVPFQQRNAADSAYLEYPFFDSDDRFRLEKPFVVVGASPSAGTYSTKFVVFQASSASANHVLLQLEGPSLTGNYTGIYTTASVTGSLDAFLYNANSGTNANSRFYAYSLGGAGDPYIQFEVSGGNTFAVGIDNSDSDKFKIARSYALGYLDVLTIDGTNGNAKHYGNLGIADATNGQACEIKTLTELLTIAAAATSTTTIQMPANSIILAVPVRVTTAVTCTSTFTVGDAGSATRFSTAAVSKAVNSTDKGTAAGAYYNATARGIVITPDTTPSDATGRVRVTIYYIECTPPTS